MDGLSRGCLVPTRVRKEPAVTLLRQGLGRERAPTSSALAGAGWPCSHLNTSVHPAAGASAQQVWQARLLVRIIVVTPLLLELDGDHEAGRYYQQHAIRAIGETLEQGAATDLCCVDLSLRCHASVLRRRMWPIPFGRCRMGP